MNRARPDFSSDDFLNAVDHILGSVASLAPGVLEEALGISLVRRSDADAPSFDAWGLEEREEGAFETVEIRMPNSVIASGSVFASITLRRAVDVGQAELGRRYGHDFSTERPSPRCPLGSVPTYLVYRYSWGAMSFGLTEGDGHLRRVVIDRTAGSASCPP